MAPPPKPRLVLEHARGRIETVILEGIPLHMTGVEHALLGRLAQRPGEPVLRDDLLKALSLKPDSLYTHVSTLRRKLGRPEFVLRSGMRARGREGKSSAYRLSGLEVEWVEVSLDRTHL